MIIDLEREKIVLVASFTILKFHALMEWKLLDIKTAIYIYIEGLLSSWNPQENLKEKNILLKN